MPKITVALTGENKENVQYVLLGDKRWGQNGEPYATEQTVASGQQTWVVDYPTTQATNTINVPNQDTAVLTVDAGDNSTTVSIA